MFKDDLKCVAATMKEVGIVRFRIDDTDAVRKMPVEVLGHDTSVVNALRRNHIDTLGELLDHWDRLGTLKNVGVIKQGKIKMGFVSWYYSTLNLTERIDFWAAFVKDNNITELEVIK